MTQGQRWCIIGGQRSGSTWLEDVIYNSLRKDFTYYSVVDNVDKISKGLRLYEFMNSEVVSKDILNYQLDVDHNIVLDSSSFPVRSKEEFINSRLNLIYNVNDIQSLIMRVLPQSKNQDFNYVDFFKNLKDQKFNLIFLRRNPLERSLSWYLMDKTKVMHKFLSDDPNAPVEYYSITSGESRSLNSISTTDPTIIDISVWRTYLEMCIDDDVFIESITSNLDCKIVNYENLEKECRENNIPIRLDNSSVIKLHDKKYEEFLTNYDEVLKVFKDMEYVKKIKNKELPDPLDTICDLKWNYPIFNLDRGEFRSCCRTPSRKVDQGELDSIGIDAFLNSKHQLQSRLDLIQGKKHADCQSCWKLENSGMTSPRHSTVQFAELLHKKKNTPGEFIYNEDALRIDLNSITDINDPVLTSYHPYMLEISLGNTCDMKCMYCSHHYSTQWGSEKIKWGEITQEQLDREFPKAPDGFNEKYWEWFDTVKLHLGRLGIIGGEPLIMPEFYQFADRLIESIESVKDQRKQKMSFWIVTNMNTPPNYLEKFFKYLPKLTEVFNVEILVSMESVGERAEYIRNGVNWNRFVNNLDKLLSRKDLNFTFGFILSLNVLNISSLKEFVQFAENLYLKYDKPIALKHNIISFPDWQSPFILTPDFADYVEDCIEYMKTRTDVMPIVQDYFGRWDQYIIFLETLSASIKNGVGDKSAERKKFASWFDTYDHRRNLKLLETFPEYVGFYEMCRVY